MKNNKKHFLKDPDATLDYVFDWTAWLQSSETIASYVLTNTGDILIDQLISYELNGKVTAWLEGGKDSRVYEITCHIVTSLGREDDRTIVIDSEER